MLTDGKGTLEEQERNKAEARARFAAQAAAREAEEAKLSEERTYRDATGSTWTYMIYDGAEVHIKKCESGARKIEVPESIEGKPVHVLMPRCMENLASLEEFSVPACITTIGSYAFSGCSGLKRVTMYCEVEAYDATWFNTSRAIEELALPHGITRLRANVIDLPALKKLKLGRACESLDPGMFAKTKLEDIYVHPSNEHFMTDGTAIYTKDGKVMVALARPVTSYKVADGCVELGKKAFSTLSCIEQITLPESLEIVGEFAYARAGISEFIAPASLKEIKNNAFSNCKNLTDVKLNEGLEAVGDEAFVNAPLKRLLFPKSLKSLGLRVTSNDKLTYAGEDATFRIHPECPHFKLDDQGCLYSVEEDGLHLSRMLNELATEVVVAEGTTVVEPKAFIKHAALQKVVLPEGCKVVGEAAFRECKKLREVTVPDSLERIEKEAFLATSIEQFRIPAALEYLGWQALITAGAYHDEVDPSLQLVEVDPASKRFYKVGSLLCEHMDDGRDQVVVRDVSDPVVRVPKEVTVIGPYAFNATYNLDELHLSDRIKTVNIRGLAFGCYVAEIFIEAEEPIEGIKEFYFDFPNTMRGIRQQGNAFGSAKTVDLELISHCYDLTITNIAAFDIGDEMADELYDQLKLIVRRMKHPVFMAPVTIDTIQKMIEFQLPEFSRVVSLQGDTTVIDSLLEEKYLTVDNIAKAVKGARGAYEDYKAHEEATKAPVFVSKNAAAVVDRLEEIAQDEFGLSEDELNDRVNELLEEEKRKEEERAKSASQPRKKPFDDYQPGKASSNPELIKAICGL